MKKTKAERELTGKHIGLLIACCMMAWGVMGLMNAYGVFFTPMGEELNTGRAAVTLHLSLRTLAIGFGSIPAARLLQKKVSIKKTMPAGMAVFLACSLGMAVTKSVILLDVLAVISGFGFSFFSYMMITIILGNWFHKNLGTFSGIAISFSGIGSAIASPVITKMLASLGFRTTYIVYSVLTVLLVVPVLFFTFTPEESGLKPYGEGQRGEASDTGNENLNLRFVMPSLLAFSAFALTLFVIGLTSLNSHLPSLAVSGGFTADVGALLLSASMIGNLSSKFVVGVIIDRVGVLKGFIIILVTSLAGFLLILFSGGVIGLLLAGGFLYGTVFSLGSLGLSILARYLYGNGQYNNVYSKMTFVTSLGSAAFVTLVGLLYDATGAYTLPVIVEIILAAASLLLTAWLLIRIRAVPGRSGDRKS